MFFFDPVKTAVVVGKLDTEKSLVLKQYDKQKEATAPAESNPSLKEKAAGKPAAAP